MSGQVCPIFERANGEVLSLIGVWVEFPVNLEIAPDLASFFPELGHIAPMVKAYLTNEPCRKVPNVAVDLGRGCKFIEGAFVMGHEHRAPNEPGGQPGVDWAYSMRENSGIIICVREEPDGVPVSTASPTSRPWWRFWR